MSADITLQHEELEQWLEANVHRYSTPTVLHLREFELDLSRFRGAFNLVLDGTVIPERFSFLVEGNGWPKVYMPMIHSPLGVPASFAAVVLTRETEDAIEAGLRSFVPRLRPFGIDRNTGEWITQSTPLVARVLDQNAHAFINQISDSPGFYVQVQIDSLRIQLFESHSRAKD